MKTAAPKATISPRNRKLAGAILAVLALQFAFVTVGGAVVSEIPIDPGTAATSEPTNLTGAALAGAPIPTSGGPEAVGDGGGAVVSTADAQRPPTKIPYYDHPFLEDECFWYCLEGRRCPCWVIIPPPKPKP